MIRVGIELNHVVRNINKQILKYYQKDIDPSLELEDIDEKDDVFKYVKFDNKGDKNEFIYIDYPYEIFGCAKTMDKELPSQLNNWLSELTNYEEDDVEISFFSLNEEALTIQSTYFFLSKIGTRVRKVVFPKDFKDIANSLDVVITTDKKILEELNGYIYKILIETGYNDDAKELADKSYDSLGDVIADEKLLHKLHDFVESDRCSNHLKNNDDSNNEK